MGTDSRFYLEDYYRGWELAREHATSSADAARILHENSGVYWRVVSTLRELGEQCEHSPVRRDCGVCTGYADFLEFLMVKGYSPMGRNS